MKRIVTFLCLGVCMMGSGLLFSQVGIGTNNPHKKAALHIIDMNKGLILPKTLNQTTLPLYNESEADETMEGMLIYNEEEKGVYIYNGEKWRKMETSSPATGVFSATKDGDTQVFACLVLACTPVNPITFNNDVSLENRSSTTYDISNMYNPSTGIATVQEDGYYLINVGVGVVSNVSVSLGNSYTNIQLQLSVQEGAYQPIAETKPRFDVLGLFNRSVGQISKSVYLRKGDRVKVVSSLNLSVSLGIYNISTDPLETYFEMIKLA